MAYESEGSLKLYLREISKTPLLTAQEELDLSQRIKQGDPEARSHMINPLFPALRSGHRLFQRPSPGKQFPSIHSFIQGFGSGRLLLPAIPFLGKGEEWRMSMGL